MNNDAGMISTIIGGLLLGGIAALSLSQSKTRSKKENYASVNTYPSPPQGQFNSQMKMNPNGMYNVSAGQPSNTINLDKSGSQLLSYQLYQQAVNASTATQQQLDSISGQSQEQMGQNPLDGGLSDSTAPYAILNDGGSQMYASEFQAVNLGSERAQSVSACAQNAPTFVSTNLLPKPSIPGQKSWDIGAPNNILANQNFLSATQQIGVDTVMGSTRNQSYDIRGSIPNPITVVGPFMNTSIMPDLQRRPLECNTPSNGLYGCGISSYGKPNSEAASMKLNRG